MLFMLLTSPNIVYSGLLQAEMACLILMGSHLYRMFSIYLDKVLQG